MKTESVDISKIIPYGNNPRENEEAIENVSLSIQEYGFRQPIVVDENYVVLAGHTRLQAGKKLKLKQVPVHIAEGLSEAQKKGYRLMDNKSAEKSNWNKKSLSLELLDLQEVNFDMNMTGFSDKEVIDLTKIVNIDDEVEVDIPTVPDEPVAKVGDFWSLGDHRLLCGDATNEKDVERLMEGEKADMVFTDPPYALFGNSTGVSGVSDDKMASPFFRDVFNACRKNTKPFGHVYCCCDWHSCNAIYNSALKVDLPIKNLIVWDKGIGVGWYYMNSHELIWFMSNNPKHNNVRRRKQTQGERPIHGIQNIWRVKKVNHKEKTHVAVKPVELISVGINASTDYGETVLDLFGGSGSTLIASEKNKRKCKIMEIEPKYCDVIIKRWEDFTGEKAQLIRK